MSDYKNNADRLTESLRLAQPPVAVALRDAAPDGVPGFEGVAPAGCAFWELAAKRTFATSTMHHEMCAIGVHTHHMSSPSEAQPRDLKTTLQAMSGLDYVRDEEVEQIPVVTRPTACAIYGPLARFPIEADVVLLFAHAQQGLILSEAVSRVDQSVPPVMGRPACAIVPQVMNNGAAAMSLGCCGARAYLDVMSESVALWALPAGKLQQYCQAVDVLARANETLTLFHRRRRRDVADGARPSVEESLHRIS